MMSKQLLHLAPLSADWKPPRPTLPKTHGHLRSWHHAAVRLYWHSTYRAVWEASHHFRAYA